MHRAARSAARTVAVLSAAYLDSTYAQAEWQAAWTDDPTGRDRKLLAFRVEDCPRPGLLGQLVTVDLFGLDRDTARGRLLAAASDERGKPAVEPAFPGAPTAESRPTGTEPDFPGRRPAVWNVPGRLATFTGRRELLEQIHGRLHASGGGRVAVVQAAALHGLGGVGKTQLAVEYAHRHATDYQLVWWIDAEQATLIGEKIAALAGPVGLSPTGVVVHDAAAVLDRLRRLDDWLLIYDNAETATAVRPWLPHGPGHVLVTSRSPGWGQLAAAVGVDVLDRPESLALLTHRVPGLDAATADALAAELGDLPLALEQAAAYLEQTAVPPADYLHRFRTRRHAMLAKGADLAYGGTVDTAWAFALERLEQTAPAAAVLLQICAQLAPEPIPLALFADHAGLLPSALSDALAGDDPAGALDDVVTDVLAYALARRRGETLLLHRLVAVVVAAHQPQGQPSARADTAAALLAAAEPGNPETPASWPAWKVLGPHLLHAAAGLAAADPHRLRSQVAGFCWYLNARGDYPAAHRLAATHHRDTAAALGDDHADTLTAARILASTLGDLGEWRRARALGEDTLARHRRVLGGDHPQTLVSASNLTLWLSVLGEPQAARTLAEDTLARSRRVLGDDDPHTLGAAHNLAVALAAMGEHRAARELDEDTLARRRRVLGEDHPHTLRSASTLAAVLRALGEHRAARALIEDILTRRRRVLGEDHPDTLKAANDLARDLSALGDHPAARALVEDILTRRRRVLGDDHPDTLDSEEFLRRLDRQAGRRRSRGRRPGPSRHGPG